MRSRDLRRPTPSQWLPENKAKLWPTEWSVRQLPSHSVRRSSKYNCHRGIRILVQPETRYRCSCLASEMLVESRAVRADFMDRGDPPAPCHLWRVHGLRRCHGVMRLVCCGEPTGCGDPLGWADSMNAGDRMCCGGFVGCGGSHGLRRPERGPPGCGDSMDSGGCMSFGGSLICGDLVCCGDPLRRPDSWGCGGSMDSGDRMRCGGSLRRGDLRGCEDPTPWAWRPRSRPHWCRHGGLRRPFGVRRTRDASTSITGPHIGKAAPQTQARRRARTGRRVRRR